MPKVQQTYQILPIKTEIKKLKHPSKEVVKKMYGTFGLDVYEKKEFLTILSEKEIKKSKNIINKVTTWITGNCLEDYEEGDSLKNVVFKYLGNKKSGLVENIQTMFGSRGIEEFNKLVRQGYVEL